MDNRKLPDDAMLAFIDDDYTQEELMRGLESGGLDAAMYNGVWQIWLTDKGYRGELMQYHAITDSFENYSLEDAFKVACEWAAAMNG